MLPALAGRPLRVELRKSLGPHLAATSIPKRVILLDRAVLSRPGDFERILIHEVFHFAWRRMSNANRRAWERVLAIELRGGISGELGWSAEWRKARLSRQDVSRRSPKWRRYACESFCDSAAWLFSAQRSHDEFTLARPARAARRAFFRDTFPPSRAIPI